MAKKFFDNMPDVDKQALSASLQLNSKADLVGGKVPSDQLPSALASGAIDQTIGNSTTSAMSQYAVSRSLLNWTDGYYINSSGNISSPNASFKYSDFILIESLKYPFTINTNAAVRTFEYRDKYGNINGYFTGSGSNLTVNSKSELPNIAADSVYIRISCTSAYNIQTIAGGTPLYNISKDIANYIKTEVESIKFTQGYFRNVIGNVIENASFKMSEIFPISILKYPFTINTNSIVRTIEYWDKNGQYVGYFTGSGSNLTVNNETELPGITIGCYFMRVSVVSTIEILSKSAKSELFAISQYTNGIDNLYDQDSHEVNGYYFDNNYEFISATASHVKFPVAEGETYAILRKENPSYRYNNESIIFLDSSSAFVSSSNEKKAYPPVDLPYNTFGYFEGLKYIVVTVPIGCAYMCFNSYINSYDSRDKNIIVKFPAISSDKSKELALKARYVLYDKKWGVLGDSLTEKNYRALNSYYDYIYQDTGLNVINYGSSGKGYKQGESEGYAFYQNILHVNPNDFDVLTIFGSGNDSAYFASNLGTASDTGTATIGGCINTAIDNFISVAPTKKIALITPTPWGSYPPTSSGNGMENYSNLIIEVGKRRGIPVLDLYHNSGLRPWDSAFQAIYYVADGTGNSGQTDTIHPNSLGHKYFYPLIKEFVKSLV